MDVSGILSLRSKLTVHSVEQVFKAVTFFEKISTDADASLQEGEPQCYHRPEYVRILRT